MIVKGESLRASLCTAVLLSVVLLNGCAGARELMLVGNDEKTHWNDAGAAVNGLAGKDEVLVVDIGSDRLAPKIVARLPLMNTIFGPPTNLQMTPDGKLALVANSMDWVADGAGWKPSPDNKLYVIDLTTDPPKLIDTVQVGKQPSGLSINRAGTLCLIANRADNSISVLRIAGTKVTLVDTVAMGEQVAHVVFTPDGKLALTADNGFAGAADGNVDTISVIDIESNPPRVIDKIVVDESPEGFAISPTGKFAVAALLRGNNSDKKAFFYRPNGAIALLKIDGKNVSRVQYIDVRGLPEGVVWSDDGQYLYVGNFQTSDISILKLDGERLVDTGKTLALPGHPASMRGRSR